MRLRGTNVIGLILPLFALAALSLGGCDRGPASYHVWGTVKFDGKPVPAGRVYFSPDFKKGNDGPQGFADIKDGAFDTRKDGKGHPGGPMVIRIEGFDGKSPDPLLVGSPIFVPHEFNRDLPKSAGEQDFDVPASAAKGLIVPTGPGP